MSKIPLDATKVFSGILFDVYHKQVEQFDWSYKTFERVRWYDVCKAICIVQNKIVVQEERQPWWIHKLWLPWGIIEPWENPDEAILREVKEELWLTFARCQKITTTGVPVWCMEWYRHYYLMSWDTVASETTMDPGEKIQTHYYTFTQFIEGIKNWSIAIYEYEFYNRITSEYILPNKEHELKRIWWISEE